MTSSLQLYGGRQLGLESIFVLAGHIARDAECLTAVAVDSAVRRGESWQDVAAAAGVSRASATARWGGSRTSALLAARVPPPMILSASTDSPSGTSRAVPHPRSSGQAPGARRNLGAALRTLRGRSRVSLSEVAAVTGLPLETVTDMVEGRTVVSWPETYTVTHALRGQPQDLLHLWECASGDRLPGGGGSTGRLAAALRGAWLAAGAPSLAVASDVDVAQARAALCGRVVPSWPTVRVLLAGLGADPAAFEALWVSARAAQLQRGEEAVPS
ncbi:helix-turn-helix domain-containing protein [Streptomyces niveus]|uniref:helix-turn-helix domain-containing protein n=1 Tax=Streptomyces niveus TaxID=193462 RepID=UPI00084CDF53|nr:helix-turn-helix domain-containing protein [Streptomyces niveus]